MAAKVLHDDQSEITHHRTLGEGFDLEVCGKPLIAVNCVFQSYASTSYRERLQYVAREPSGNRVRLLSRPLLATTTHWFAWI